MTMRGEGRARTVRASGTKRANARGRAASAGLPRPRAPKQLPLTFRTWGGARRGAGRKPKNGKAGVPHRTRPALDSRHPVHVTLRVTASVRPLRRKKIGRTVFDAFAIARERFGARLTHFSIQHDHLHLLVEARDRKHLSKALHALSVRLAKRINAALRRRGRVFGDRFHARALKTPLETRRAVLYVMNNYRRHHAQFGERAPFDWADPYSSVNYFDGFARLPSGRRPRAEFELGRGPPVAAPRTWLLAAGWRKRGLLPLAVCPGGARRR